MNQGHPGKEGPAGEKGTQVSQDVDSQSLRILKTGVDFILLNIV